MSTSPFRYSRMEVVGPGPASSPTASMPSRRAWKSAAMPVGPPAGRPETTRRGEREPMLEASETAVREHRYVIPGRVLPDKPVESLEEYLALGGGDALQIALQIPPEDTLDRIKRSGLRGRGGAGFPTGINGAALRSDPATIKYLCCNGAEGEPATFKDRMLMRRNPYQLLEGVAIAAHASGAKGAFVALKRRFRTEVKALERARLEMMEYGLLGPVPLELRYGPDAYLFGEERGLLEVIEGRDPLPRILPPYMQGILADPQHPS